MLTFNEVSKICGCELSKLSDTSGIADHLVVFFLFSFLSFFLSSFLSFFLPLFLSFFVWSNYWSVSMFSVLPEFSILMQFRPLEKAYVATI